jgi:hypothetical protein
MGVEYGGEGAVGVVGEAGVVEVVWMQAVGVAR